MTRETRLNLIFIAVLLTATLPGAVILFKKKLDPYAPSNMLPEGRPVTTAYIDPGPLPPGIDRVVPRDAAVWTASLRGGRPLAEPVISDHRLFEVVDLKTAPGACDVFVIVWGRGYTDAGTELAALVTSGNRTVPAQSPAGTPIVLPENVLRTLQSAGYTRTPHQVQSVHLHFPVESPGFPLTLTLTATSGDQRTQDSVQLPRNPFVTAG